MIFIYAYVFVYVRSQVQCSLGTAETVRPPGAGAAVGGRCPMWETGTESGSLAREVTALNH